MSIDSRPDDETEPHDSGSVEEQLFADLPAFDVVDGELMPRARKPRR